MGTAAPRPLCPPMSGSGAGCLLHDDTGVRKGDVDVDVDGGVSD